MQGVWHISGAITQGLVVMFMPSYNSHMEQRGRFERAGMYPTIRCGKLAFLTCIR